MLDYGLLGEQMVVHMTGRWQRCGKEERGAALKHNPAPVRAACSGGHANTAERERDSRRGQRQIRDDLDFNLTEGKLLQKNTEAI